MTLRDLRVLEMDGRDYRDLYHTLCGDSMHLQCGSRDKDSGRDAMLLADRRRARNDAMLARRELGLAQARIRALESQLQQMGELVRADQLTGILNRRGLHEAFEREFARASRQDAALCIAVLDLDNFKHINDSFGHDAGDAVLVHFSAIVSAALRNDDVLARFGGEEFVLLLPATNPAEALTTIARIQAALAARPCVHEGVALPVTFSAGATSYETGEEIHVLMKRADAAVYKAKRAGKNQTVFSGTQRVVALAA